MDDIFDPGADDDFMVDDVIDDYIIEQAGGSSSSSNVVSGAGGGMGGMGGASSSAMGGAGSSRSANQGGRASSGEPNAKRVRVDLKDRTNVQIPDAIDYKQWQRNQVPADYLNRPTLSFMQVDLDDYQAPIDRDFVKPETNPNQEAPILRMYGITKEGYSVLAHIHGFLPYFYCPMGFNCSPEAFEKSLEVQLRNAQTGGKALTKNVLKVDVVNKTNIFEWSEEGPKPFFLVKIGLQRLMQQARQAIETGFQLTSGGGYSGYGTYETNVPFPLRFLIDQDLSGGSWVDIERGHYKIRRPDQQSGRAQIELDVFWLNAKPSQETTLIAPMRILSFDIECWNQFSKGFPVAEVNPVIQIAAEVKEVGAKENNCQVVWTLDSCGDLADTTVLSFEDEREMLLSFARFMVAVDADLVTGYNIINFDIPYLLTRAQTLDAKEFLQIGRLLNIPARIREYTSPQGRLLREIRCDGRIIFDMYTVIQKEHNLRSYTLNFVSSNFLGDQKEDVHYSLIGTLHTGSTESRRRLAAYCLKDAKLPLRLMEKLCCIYNYIEMARVTGTPINFLLNRGQAIKVFGMILRKARTVDYIVPAKKVEASDDKFEGATVLTPKTDYYTVPIATLDFASLYPSIMMAHNLCYCTLVPAQRIRGNKVEGLSDSEYTQTPCGNYFVNPSTRKGLLPQILEELLTARKKAKKEMNAEKDPFKAAVLNGRQLALKVSANSVYGFTGATIGMMPCLEISSSVTAFGRTMIEATKAEVERVYTRANGYAHDADVVYGDTDSVMIKFGPETVKECMDLGNEAADRISASLFKKPIKLEFEKVYYPYLLLNKKRYAGLYWTQPDKFDKLDTKGLETVRRDNCGLVQKLCDQALRTILIDRSLPGAIKFVQDTISDLLQNKVDMALLIISKSIGRGGAESYAAKQAHVELAERMRKRNPATAPNPGDRVPYVIVKSMKKTMNYDKSEDPLYVLENGLSIDAQWYIDHQLSGPLLRIFEPIIQNAADKLFKGDHTRKIVASSGAGASSAGGALGGLIAKSTAKACLGCRITLKAEQSELGLCTHCLKSKGPEIYEEKLKMARSKQTEYSRLWSECQRCQDSLHQEVICANCDCPIFYKRQKAKIDLLKAEQQLKSLNLEW